MSKKSKKNLQKSLEKRRALQTETSKPNTSLPTRNAPQNARPELPDPVNTKQPLLEEHHSKEITRTLISVLIIAALLVGAYIAARETHYISTFGDKIYSALRLKN